MSASQDQNRPPVLAHVRFVAERSVFSGLDLVERFRHIHRTNLWGAAAPYRGLDQRRPRRQTCGNTLRAFRRELGARSLLDAPCGDGSWISDLDLGLCYTGVDIVPELIDDLRRRAEAAGISPTYLLADITRDPLPRADAILCRDCLVHLSFANIAAAVANFGHSGAEWLITTTFPELKANIDCDDGDWRALNFELAPFNRDAPGHFARGGLYGREWRLGGQEPRGLADRKLAAAVSAGIGRTQLQPNKKPGRWVGRVQKSKGGELTPFRSDQLQTSTRRKRQS